MNANYYHMTFKCNCMSQFNISGTSKIVLNLFPHFFHGVRNCSIKIWLFVYISLRSKIRLLLTKKKNSHIFFRPMANLLGLSNFEVLEESHRLMQTCIKKVE